jgi:hypothetical protein
MHMTNIRTDRVTAAQIQRSARAQAKNQRVALASQLSFARCCTRAVARRSQHRTRLFCSFSFDRGRLVERDHRVLVFLARERRTPEHAI